MPNFKNSKIYFIKSSQTKQIYIGATTQTLSRRFSKHKSVHRHINRYGSCRSGRILNYGDAYIELYEIFPCNNKEELSKREGELVRKHSKICVNCQIPGRTHKQYCKDNKEKIVQNKRKYYENNKEYVRKIQKKYYEDNRERRRKDMKKYYDDNRERILERSRKTFPCDCGSRYKYGRKKRHEKTIKHNKFFPLFDNFINNPIF